MQYHNVHLLLGSNLGDRRQQLLSSLEAIKVEIGTIFLQSSFYETEAWGKDDLPPHLNIGVVVLTNLAPQQLLEKVKQIEVNLGRTPTEKWGIRAIDIDIIFIEDQIIDTQDLIIPHIWMQDRKFVLQPLVEITPNFKHPILLDSLSTLLKTCKDPLWVKLID